MVQRKEAHDYRCLFRVCFMPENLQTMLDQDPASFTYLYLQVDRSLGLLRARVRVCARVCACVCVCALTVIVGVLRRG